MLPRHRFPDRLEDRRAILILVLDPPFDLLNDHQPFFPLDLDRERRGGLGAERRVATADRPLDILRGKRFGPG